MATDEKSLIARIVHGLPNRHTALRIGPGDDAAVIRSAGEFVVSCDAFLEGVHFLPRIHPPDSVGYKSLARAASDLAAMGVPLKAPRFFLLTLALPREKCGRWLDGFLRGMKRCARELHMTLAGGDVSQQKHVAICVTVMAMTGRAALVKRGGARPGDAIFVSGQLGAAQLGLELLTGKHQSRQAAPLRRHFYPQTRMELGAWLARERFVSAMIDTSDGLSSDMRNLCDASGAGARVFRDALPLAGDSRDANAMRRALHGGEDYELLFTVPARLATRIPQKYRGVRISKIGEIIRGKSVELVDEAGKTIQFSAQGWDAFRKNQHEHS